MKWTITLLLVTLQFSVYAQGLPASRKVDWTKAGLQLAEMPAFTRIVDVTTRGVDVNNAGAAATNSDSLNLLIDTSIKPIVISFPAGTYYFSKKIVFQNQPASENYDSVILRGESSTATQIIFNGGGVAGSDVFEVRGRAGDMVAQGFTFVDALKGQTSIVKTSDPVTPLNESHHIRIYFNDLSLLPGPPDSVVGQIARIVSKSGTGMNTLGLSSPLRRTFTGAEGARFIRVTTRKWVGFENFKLVREDSTASATYNFEFSYASNCWVRGVESEKTNSAHVLLENSVNCLVDSVYFHESHNYRGYPFGQAIGILLSKASSECKIQNSIFAHLRQAVIFQQGVNGNVYAYNYSTDPYWYDPATPLKLFPRFRSPDINFHGHYAFANLVEGNIAQNILLDDEHGNHGPYNTFLRNRAELYGIKVHPGLTTDTLNFIGNEVTYDSVNLPVDSSGFSYQAGAFIMDGNGHFVRGNLIRCRLDSAGKTLTTTDTSYAYATRPSFLSPEHWGAIGWPNQINSGTIPAKERYCNMFGCTPVNVSCLDSNAVNVYISKDLTYSSSAWNRWVINSTWNTPSTTSTLNYASGTSSGYTATLSHQGVVSTSGLTDDGSPIMAPFEALRERTAVTSNQTTNSRTLTLNVTNSKKYNLEIYASSVNAGQRTVFEITNNGVTLSDTINTDGNRLFAARFFDLVPNANTIVVTIKYGLPSGTRINYLNGFKLTEIEDINGGGSVAKRTTPAVESTAPSTTWMIYPNPANTRIQVKSTGETASVSVYTADGRLVIAPKNITAPVMEMNISKLKKGLYYVHYRNKNGLQVQKLVVQ